MLHPSAAYPQAGSQIDRTEGSGNGLGGGKNALKITSQGIAESASVSALALEAEKMCRILLANRNAIYACNVGPLMDRGRCSTQL